MLVLFLARNKVCMRPVRTTWTKVLCASCHIS
jgi:hypothetical protein